MSELTHRFVFIVLVSTFCFESFGQESEKTEDEVEINYVWIDTMVTIGDSEVRLVSNNLIEISCCMKSPKYSRTSAKAARWIRKNYDSNYGEQELPFKTLQNRDLAVTVIEAAKEKAQTDEGIKMVDYEFKCN